jgi:hypothetical protein
MNSFWAALSLRLARRKRIREALALTVLAAGVAAGAGLYIGVDGLYVKLTAPPPGAAAMTAIGSYLTQSASVRSSIQAAIAGVQSCSASPASGEAGLQHAISTRQHILNGLRTLSVSRLPNGTQLVSTLTTAMQDSITADREYRSWMVDFASSGGTPCQSDPSQDPNYVAGANASGAATTAKNAFLAIWNAMAPRYRQPIYPVTGF